MNIQFGTALLLTILNVYLFKDVNDGINILLFQFVFLGSLFALFPEKKTDKVFAGLALGLLANSVSIVFYPNIITNIAYYLTCVLIAGRLAPQSLSMLGSLFNGLYALSLGWLINTKRYVGGISLKDSSFFQRQNALIYGLPFVITLIFINLYSSANPAFRDIFLTIGNGFQVNVVSLLEYGLFFGFSYCALVAYTTPIHHPRILEFEEGNSDVLTPSATRLLKQEDETKLSILLLGSLNVVLLLFHLTDLPHLFSAGPESVTLSQYLHQGVNTLSISVILATGILLYVFRNTQALATENKLMRVAASAWLIQNAFLVATSVWKNIAYIAAYGLTYKRIGVFLFLCVVMTGLTTTISKINRQHSLWKYIQNNAQIAVATLLLTGLVNWDSLIFRINTSFGIQADVDISYLLRLENPDVLWLDRYFENHPDELLQYSSLFVNRTHDLQPVSWKSWPNRESHIEGWFERWSLNAHEERRRATASAQQSASSSSEVALPTREEYSESAVSLPNSIGDVAPDDCDVPDGDSSARCARTAASIVAD